MLDLGASVLTVEDDVTRLEDHLFVLRATTYGDDLATQGLFLSRVRDNNPAGCLLFLGCRAYKDAVCQWFNAHDLSRYLITLALLTFWSQEHISLFLEVKSTPKVDKRLQSPILRSHSQYHTPPQPHDCQRVRTLCQEDKG